MTLHVGIDLGTTNSAAAVFDGNEVQIVRASDGASITPSVVRIDAKGRVTVGAKARKQLDADPENVRSEFKRLMGTPHALGFAASGAKKKPEELSAEVLRALREDVRAQTGVLPERAVISVPALFELPQTTATSEAARLAGFERVEMIQEPVASAIAAGFREGDSPLPWLVYDLGGGTFDVSLLETQEGLLRVVGHDGDNFLGGRDFDGAVVDWAIERIVDEHGARLERRDPDALVSLRRLRAAAEEAKIELSRAREAEISVTSLRIGREEIDVSIALTRAELERLVSPLVERSIEVCVGLMARHGIRPGASTLSRVVLVGGPTSMPMLRERVAEILSAPLGDGLDPMTLVARGAALYAASANLDARPKTEAAKPKGVALWMQYPAMTADATPYVIGKLVDAAEGKHVRAVVFSRADGSWTGEAEALDADGTFAALVSLVPRTRTELKVEGRSESGASIAVSPASIAIVHGATAMDPPLSRSIGIALATDGVQTYFERGSPLPMRRTFTLRTVASLGPSDPDAALRVPIVQGELPYARLCRLVGTLEIQAKDLTSTIPAGAPIEVTIELDRGGRLAATARVPGSGQSFDQVAHLVAGTIPIEELEQRLADLSKRLHGMRAEAFRTGARETVTTLARADALVAGATRDLDASRGGDLDAGEKARRALSDLDGLLASVEAALAWPELDAKMRHRVAVATSWVAQFGTADERKVLSAAVASLERARKIESHEEMKRQMGVIDGLFLGAYYRSPGAYENELDSIVQRIPEASDPKRARALLEQGQAASQRGDVAGVEQAVRAIWGLLPPRIAEGGPSHGSGVR